MIRPPEHTVKCHLGLWKAVPTSEKSFLDGTPGLRIKMCRFFDNNRPRVGNLLTRLIEGVVRFEIMHS
jgi:hypothetical protein